ncbi:hypothetical protein CPAV1605_791 [seawater metagenome]|uniref:Uncharacterized protein n=1 Tax=seawater metagenome TaxID=1561972 RepID=A0A5E8CIX8_9ZZZZ
MFLFLFRIIQFFFLIILFKKIFKKILKVIKKIIINFNLFILFRKYNGKNKKDKRLKICFITSLISNKFSEFIDYPKGKKFDNFDFKIICDKNVNFDGWDTIYISKKELAKHADINETYPLSEIYMSRYAKFMIWEYFEKNKIKYDYIVYCDSYLYPKETINWDYFIEDYLKNNDIIQTLHNVSCLSDCNGVVKFKKDTEENILKLKEYLNERNYDLNSKNYYENTILIYNTNNDNLKKTLSEFWKIYTKEKLTYRDQPLWNYVCEKNNIRRPRLPYKSLFEYFFYKNQSKCHIYHK